MMRQQEKMFQMTEKGKILQDQINEEKVGQPICQRIRVMLVKKFQNIKIERRKCKKDLLI